MTHCGFWAFPIYHKTADMKIDRLMGIVTILLQQDKVTAPELARRFEVSNKKFCGVSGRFQKLRFSMDFLLEKIRQCVEKGLLSWHIAVTDSTHIKANAPRVPEHLVEA